MQQSQVAPPVVAQHVPVQQHANQFDLQKQKQLIEQLELQQQMRTGQLDVQQQQNYDLQQQAFIASEMQQQKILREAEFEQQKAIAEADLHQKQAQAQAEIIKQEVIAQVEIQKHQALAEANLQSQGLTPSQMVQQQELLAAQVQQQKVIAQSQLQQNKAVLEAQLEEEKQYKIQTLQEIVSRPITPNIDLSSQFADSSSVVVSAHTSPAPSVHSVGEASASSQVGSQQVQSSQGLCSIMVTTDSGERAEYIVNTCAGQQVNFICQNADVTNRSHITPSSNDGQSNTSIHSQASGGVQIIPTQSVPIQRFKRPLDCTSDTSSSFGSSARSLHSTHSLGYPSQTSHSASTR